MERWQRQALQRGDAGSADLAMALTCEGPHGPVIHAMNRVAKAAGVSLGARLTDMRALVPDLRVDAADPQGDRASLHGLALWARRWCPWTAADAPEDMPGESHGLILDSTGSAHLWGGEAAMLEEIEAGLAMLGFTARPALAPSWGAAWALARYAPARGLLRGADWPRSEALRHLPAAALRLEAETVLLLNRLGLKTIGALADLPRLALARRFPRQDPARNPLIRLDQLTGHLPEPVSPPEAPPLFRADARLAEPIFDLTHHLPDLCLDLCDQLARAGRGARRLCLTVYRTDGEVSRIEAACASASRDAKHLAFLFRDRLEKIRPGFGFDLISLEAPLTEAMGINQPDLAGGTETALELSQLIDRLAARFGKAALTRLDPVESHIPERAEALRAPLSHAPDTSLPETERPQRLLTPAEEVLVLYAVPEGPPAQFQWRRRVFRIARYQGPERIAPEWWHDRPGTRLRDYFKVEDAAGHRFWLYREGLHEDGRGGDPRWFLHGVFA